ncbi:MAG: hypothetical protein QOC64_241 [Solirubrobacteraceae bacterium]|nr:hypothetical protein [Solirubrobacteraceae bacterium]
MTTVFEVPRCGYGHGAMGVAPEDWAARAVEAARDTILTVDADARVVEANPAAEGLFRASRDQLIGRPVSELIAGSATDPEAAPPVGTRMDGRARRPDGEELPVEVTVVRGAEGPVALTAFVCRPAPGGMTTVPSHLERLLVAAQELAHIGSWELDLRSGEAIWSPGLYNLLGLDVAAVDPPISLMMQWVHPHDRARIEAVLASVMERPEGVSEDGLSSEFRIVRPDAAVRELRSHGVVQRDDSGTPVRWVAIVQDVTAELLQEQELQAHYAVSQALRQWESFDEGVIDLLRRVGTALHYPMGSLWRWDDEQEALVCRAFWHAPDIDPAGFDLIKRSLVFRPGDGKPGVAWETQEPVVTPDAASDPVFEPRLPAIDRGVSCGLAFPAIGPDGPIAVLSYYSYERRVPSASLVRTLSSIGRELGRFLARRRAQLGPRPLSEREIEVLRLASDGLSGPAIAEQLVLSPSTVKTHFENVYEKLGVSDRAAAVALALRMGLFT